MVNPYDRRALKDAFSRAVEAPSNELADGMRQMRAHLRDHDVWVWARAFLAALDEARAGDG